MEFLARLQQLATPRVLISALVLGIIFIGAGGWDLWSVPAATHEDPGVGLSWIQGPTNTPAPPTATLLPTSTATQEFVPPSGGELGIGSYVQIVGTEGTGLNIRSAPGLSSQIEFLAYDSEVFVVRDGPREQDGLTWWYLVTPVDETRAGWAAASYIEVVANP